MEQLSTTTQLLYSELLQQCAVSLPNQRGISFVTKVVSNKRYWYIELVVGSTKRQFSLGRDTEELRALITKQKQLFENALPDLKQRQILVSMLVNGGAFAPPATEGRIIEVLSQAGTFLPGGVLVGSHAFNAIGNMLGVNWGSAAMQTQDMDIASLPQINVAIPQNAPSVKSLILESGLGYFEVPALSLKSPSTSFKLRGQQFMVDLLTPLKGPDSDKPVLLPHYKSYAHPVRFLEYLLENTQEVVIPFRSGILVSVPDPARFALHKLVVSQRRPIAQQMKSKKDILQARTLLGLLFEERPGDVLLALDAAKKMPNKFQSQLAQGIKRLPDEIKEQFPSK